MHRYLLAAVLCLVGWAVAQEPEAASQDDVAIAAEILDETVEAAAEAVIDAAGEVGGATDAPSEEQLFLDGAVRALMRELDVLGAVVSVVRDGEVIARGGWGYADVERTKPMDPAVTLVRPGSISKTFTWTLVMMLAEEGKLDLDADVNTYLDGFALESPFDEPVTMRAILAHQAGFEDRGRGLFTLEPGSSLQKTMAKAETRIINPPFEAPSYSNYASALAGLIVANLEGKPFDDVVEERLLTPLGMTRSTFRGPLPRALADGMSDNPRRVGGQFVDGGYVHIGSYGPAGSLSATADDMSRYMRAHLNDGAFGGTQIFSADVAQKLREPLSRFAPGMRAMLHGFYERPFGDGFAYGHGGGTMGFFSQMVLHPESGTGLFVNFTGPDGWPASLALTRSYGTHFLGQDLPPRQPIPAGYTVPEEVLGQYRTLRMNFSTIEKVFDFGETEIFAADDGALIKSEEGNLYRYLPVERQERVFVGADDPTRQLAFSGQGTEQALYMSGGPYQAFRRIGAWESASLHSNIVIIGLITALWSVFAGLKRIPAAFSATGTERLAGFSIFTAAVILLAFSGGFINPLLNMSSWGLLENGLPMLNFWLSLSLAGAVLTGLAVLTIVPVWLGGTWGIFSKLTFTVQALVLAVFVWSLNYWNLVGPWNN